MANLSKITIPVKDQSSGEVTDQTFDLNGPSTDTYIVFTQDSSYLNKRVIMSKTGNVVAIRIDGLKDVPQGSTVKLFDLPADFKPAYSQYVTWVSNSFGYEVKLTARASGELDLYAYSNGSQEHITGTFTYIL